MPEDNTMAKTIKRIVKFKVKKPKPKRARMVSSGSNTLPSVLTNGKQGVKRIYFSKGMGGQLGK